MMNLIYDDYDDHDYYNDHDLDNDDLGQGGQQTLTCLSWVRSLTWQDGEYDHDDYGDDYGDGDGDRDGQK